jgi:hypothetical protein
MNNITACALADRIILANPDSIFFSASGGDPVYTGNTYLLIQCFKMKNWMPLMMNIGGGAADPLLGNKTLLFLFFIYYIFVF